MAIGTVKFFNQDKGFGFITPDDGGQDVFVHVSGVIAGGPLRDGSKVSYDLGQDRKTGKSKAENVRALLSTRQGRRLVDAPAEQFRGNGIWLAGKEALEGQTKPLALLAGSFAERRHRRAEF